MKQISQRSRRTMLYLALFSFFIGAGLLPQQTLSAATPGDEMRQESPRLTTAGGEEPIGPDKPPFTGGQVVEEPVFVTQPDRIEGVDAPNAGPTIDIWYGDRQTFGQIGRPIRWVNILGNVSPIGTLDKLEYSLNNGSFKSLDVGPGVFPASKRRLYFDGDFSVELAHSALVNGENTVTIRARDTQGQVTTRTIIIDYTPNRTWPLPYVADWGKADKIEDVAQVSDGRWAIVGDSVRVQQLAYDRLIAIGDMSWTNYEVTVPVTIHGIDQNGFGGPSGSPGLGLILRWQGHYYWDTDGQLANGWEELGTLDWFRWEKNEQDQIVAGLERIGAKADVFNDVTPAFNTQYIIKAQVEDRAICGDEGYYRLKVWRANQSEPSGWNIEGCDKDMSGRPSPSSGSFLLVAHHVDASFGQVLVTPLNYRANLTVTSNGNGSTAVAPQQADYAYYEEVTLTAAPDPNNVFTGWSGDIVSTDNPLTFNIIKNTNVTANFVVAEYTIDVETVGEGTVVKSPDKPVYGYQEQVELTAAPAPGWRLDKWSGTVDGAEPTKTLTMIQSHEITATFVVDYYDIETRSELPNGNSGALGVIQLSDPANPAGYLYGEPVTATAIAATGWSFLGWRDALTGIQNPGTFTVTGDSTVVGIFQLNQYTLSAATEGLGSVALDSEGPYSHGATVQATAIAREGWTFKEWTGDVPVDQQQEAVVTITMDRNKSITAVFDPDVLRVYMPLVNR